MSDPQRYREQPDELGQAFSETRGLVPWSPDEQRLAFHKLSRRSPSPWPKALRFAAVASALGLAILVPLGVRHRQALSAAEAAGDLAATRVIDLGTVGQLQLEQAIVELPGQVGAEGYHVSLRAGRLCAQVNHRDVSREGPFLVEAPHLQVTVVGTRFCVQAGEERSTVSVSEGKVRVKGDGVISALVAAGEALASDAPALATPVVPPLAALPPAPVPTAAAAPVAAPAPRPSCATLAPLAAQEDCYAALIAGDDLVAEDAVYSLALLRRDRRHDGPGALSGFRAYLARFPGGALAPEAEQNVLSELLRERRPGEALTAADDYLRRFAPRGSFEGTDRRTQEVALTRAKLLRGELDRAADALQAYDALLGSSLPADLREEALFAAADCEARLGRGADARSRFAGYLREFPHGPHAVEARQRQGAKRN